MNIIERYICSYIVHCLFPEIPVDPTHMGYVYQVLAETGSTPKNELLRRVLDFTRTSGAENEYTKKSVAGYVRSMLDVKRAESNPNAPPYIGKWRSTEEATVVMVLKNKHPIAFAGCPNEKVDECFSELKSTFPGIELIPME